MMGRRCGDQASLFYQFRLDERIPKEHLLRRIDGFVTAALADMHERLKRYYSEIGRPSVDPELMIRVLVVDYCYGLRSERESDIFRHVFERVVTACMAAGLVKGEGFAVDASVMEANASRYHGKAPNEIAWAEPERRTRAVKEYYRSTRGRGGGQSRP